MIISKRDILIEELINDKNYRFDKNCKITTLITKSGKISKKLIWRDKNPYINQGGYYVLKYKKKMILYHRIVYRFFIGKLDKNLVINHIDGDKLNNNILNLELITSEQNSSHGHKLSWNLISKTRKFNQNKIKEIFNDKENGLTYTEMAGKHKCSKSTLCYILNKKTYKF
jgi:hypothetical protein